ncbi:MAG: penicillin-binding protein activator, partial [Pseudomonadota bacterium]
MKHQYQSIFTLIVSIWLLTIAGCGGKSDKPLMVEQQQPLASNEAKFLVSALLPISGPASAYGNAVQDGMNLALKTAASNELAVKFIDTGQDYSSWYQQLNSQIKAGTSLVIGPLLSKTKKAKAPAP